MIRDQRRGRVGNGLAFHGRRRGLFEALHVAGGEQGPHLSDGDIVEGGEAFGLWQPLADEHGVEAFEVGEND